MRQFSIRHILCWVAFVFIFPMGGYAQEGTITPSTALQAYLNNGDLTYRWEVKERSQIDKVTLYDLLLTSQKWQDLVWTHQLTILVPDGLNRTEALLFIDGGSGKEGLPNWVASTDNKQVMALATLATQNKAIVAVVRQIPNQPLFDNLVEDALISFTLHHFQQDGNYTWPLLFPMTKGAVRAMDAVTEFCAEQLQRKIDGFVITGASKRGWTTWLTASQDDRVLAAVPMVIDVLNMPRSMTYQQETFGGYSEQIQDYSNLGILQAFNSEKGRALVEMIDPYSYRKNLTMPKLLLMGTNDEYWVTDNVKMYLDSIPGINRLHYIPNAGHNLNGGEEAFQTLGAFFALLLSDEALPACNWQAKVTGKNLKIEVELSADQLIEAELWSTTADTRDFRKSQWSSTPLPKPEKEKFSVSVPLPQTGYGACYVDLKYKTTDGQEYKLSTRVFMTSSDKLL